MAEPENPARDALQRAISAAGTQALLMEKLNTRGWEISSRNVIAEWVRNGVPAKYCPDIEELTGVRCEELCPEVKWGLVRDRRQGKRPASDAQKASA